LAVARARLDQAEINRAKFHLSATNIKAPFSGNWPNSKKLGSLIDKGELLTSLSDNSEMFAYFNVSEQNI
jgi:membrane fusion protein (multidrug efflux system)